MKKLKRAVAEILIRFSMYLDKDIDDMVVEYKPVKS